MMETRKSNDGQRSSPLPVDYLKMVSDVFSTHFADSLKALSKIKAKPYFSVKGAVFPEEIALSITLHHEGHITATTVRTSSDFDPKASSPTAEDVLAACVDTMGDVLQTLFGSNEEKQLKALTAESLAQLDNVPIEWTAVTSGKHKIYVLVDKSNPTLDDATDKWLNENDPKAKAHKADEEKASESLFVTGKKSNRDEMH